VTVLEPALRNNLVELIASNFNADEINELGKLVLGAFDANRLSGIQSHISVSPRKSANRLVEQAASRRHTESLIKLVTELDQGILLGRQINVEGLEIFLNRLARSGLIYDFQTRKIISTRKDLAEMVNWGSLKDGKIYEITVMSLDIVENSKLFKRFGISKMEKLYYKLWNFLKQKLAVFDGRMWSWAGDGGIMAFAFKDQVCRAVQCAIEIQSTIPFFNMSDQEAFPIDISLRIAIDTGTIKFFSDTGKIVSEVINYAAHLESTASLAVQMAKFFSEI
jgi:class 3 adenylate cyclase